MKYKFVALLALLLIISGCADSVPVTFSSPVDLVGFWHGLWHGVTIFFSWIGSMFSDDIAIYAVYNNGGWYDFGFFMGLGMALGGSASIK